MPPSSGSHHYPLSTNIIIIHIAPIELKGVSVLLELSDIIVLAWLLRC